METCVDLLRHGEVAGGARLRGARTDDPLSERGWAALRRAVDAGGPWDVIASSPLSRCAAFAESLARSARLIVDPRLAEYDFGDWDGQPLDQLWAEQGEALARFLADPERMTPPGGEHAADFQARVRAAWESMLARAAGRRILVIGHGGVLRQWLTDALGAPMSAQASIEWPHAAMTRLRVHDDPPRPRAVSLAFHARQPGEGAPRMDTNQHG